MITENDLLEAIAECQGVRNPNANVCIKLAAYYTILDHMNDKIEDESQPVQFYHSYSPENKNAISYESDSEFSQKIYGRNIDEILPIIDELMTTLQVINPRLYAGVMRKLAD